MKSLRLIRCGYSIWSFFLCPAGLATPPHSHFLFRSPDSVPPCDFTPPLFMAYIFQLSVMRQQEEAHEGGAQRETGRDSVIPESSTISM